MHHLTRLGLLAGGLGLATLAMTAPVLAHPSGAGSDGVSPETAYVLNTFSMLVWGALVMWMAAGFTVLEAGLVRYKNTAAICLKNICLFSIAGLMFFLIGYDLMYPGDAAFGIVSYFERGALTVETARHAGNLHPEVLAHSLESGHSRMSDWFFQMVFVATSASIISGTLAERIKVGSFLLFVVLLTGFLYPIQGQWIWGDGWLQKLGFKDFAGASVVHSVGGWCALTGAIVLGARKGVFEADGGINPMPGANLPLATLGTFILWFGWFGFNAGSVHSLGSAADAALMSAVVVNTTLAAASGVVTALLCELLIFGNMRLPYILNGAIAGLVSITAGANQVNPIDAIVIGGIGGTLMIVSIPLIERFRIDDVVGAISAHLVAGIWGTLAVAIFGTGNLLAQLIGIGAIALVTVSASSIVWLGLKHTIGIRVSDKAELEGMDKAELENPDSGLGQRDLSGEIDPNFGPGI